MTNILKLYLISVLALSISGCFDSDPSDWPCESCIWKEDSQRILITHTGGIIGGTYTTADYTTDTIPEDVLNFLKTMKETKEPKVDNTNDLHIYHIIITDSSGVEYSYYDNVELHRIPEQYQDGSWIYFSRDDMEDLHRIILNQQ